MVRSGWLICVSGLCVAAPSLAAERAAAQIRGTQTDGPLSGVATFLSSQDGVQVMIAIADAPPGLHGIHIHEHGSCEDGGNAAGGHYNPDGAKHGFLPKDGLSGSHAGDLGNIEIGPDGAGYLTLTAAGLTLGGPSHDIVGRAVILHEKADDFGQPTGNAGGRIGCGVITTGG